MSCDSDDGDGRVDSVSIVVVICFVFSLLIFFLLLCLRPKIEFILNLHREFFVLSSVLGQFVGAPRRRHHRRTLCRVVARRSFKAGVERLNVHDVLDLVR